MTCQNYKLTSAPRMSSCINQMDILIVASSHICHLLYAYVCMCTYTSTILHRKKEHYMPEN